MTFGSVAIEAALGTILAHSVKLDKGVLRKGKTLTDDDIAALRDAGIAKVTVANYASDDLPENVAANRIGACLTASGLRLTEPVAGRVNLISESAGIIRVDGGVVAAMNAVDEAVTLATLPDFARVAKGALVATVKVIPYGVAEDIVDRVCGVLSAAPITLHPFQERSAALILTRTDGMKDSLFTKAQNVMQSRLTALGARLDDVRIIPHDTPSLTSALREVQADLVLILTASATSDRADVAPAAVEAAGGQVLRYGMPVDPGNLLFLAHLDGRDVVGLPGCARSPALNGADWVLERIAAGLTVTSQDIAAMGVGGLLKEIPERGQPRRAKSHKPAVKQRAEILLLAAGQSSRMRGEDKLLRSVDGDPLLRRMAKEALAAGVPVHVVLPDGNEPRHAALNDLALDQITTKHWVEGMAASLREGLGHVSSDAGAVIVALADMPDITTAHYTALITAWMDGNQETICRATTREGTLGHPVLFPRRYFETLIGLSGDVGARALLRDPATDVTLVPTPGQGAVTDLDTPEAWADWEAARS